LEEATLILMILSLALLPLVLVGFARIPGAGVLSYSGVLLSAVIFWSLGRWVRQRLGVPRLGVLTDLASGQLVVFLAFVLWSLFWVLVPLDPYPFFFAGILGVCAIFAMIQAGRTRSQGYDWSFPVCIAILGLVPWAVYSTHFGGLGHDTPQHIAWSAAIRWEGYRGWSGFGANTMDPYPRGLHILVHLWGLWVPERYLGTLTKAMPVLQSLLGLAWVIELTQRRYFPQQALRVQALGLAILGFGLLHLQDNGLQEATGRTSALFFLVCLAATAWNSSFGRLRYLLFVGAAIVLVSINPAFVLWVGILGVVFLLSLGWDRNVSSWPKLLMLLLAATLGLLCVGSDPFYLSSLAQRFDGLAWAVRSLTGLSFPWDHGVVVGSKIPDALAASSDLWAEWLRVTRPLWSRDFLPLGFLPFVFKWAEPWQQWTLLVFFVLALGVSLRESRALGRLGLCIAGLWGLAGFYYFCQSLILVSLPPSNVRHLFEGYTHHVWIAMNGLGVIAALWALAVGVLSCRVKALRVPAWALFLAVSTLGYGSKWTFEAPRSSRVFGGVLVEDLANLRKLEQELNGQGLLLPCIDPIPGREHDPLGSEAWLVSVPSSELFAWTQGARVFCNYQLGHSAKFTVTDLKEFCSGPEAAQAVMDRFEIRALAYFHKRNSKRSFSSIDGTQIPMCHKDQSIVDYGFASEPSRTMGRVLVFERPKPHK
jgi:hypothetical protein